MADPLPPNPSSTGKSWRNNPAKLLNLDRVLGRSRNSVTAIDVDGHVMRVAQTSHKGKRARVTRFAVRQLDIDAKRASSNPAELGLAIRKALAELKINPRQVVMGLPRALAVLRTISLPEKCSQGEMASMVRFQTAKDLPFPMDQAIIDFKVQGTILMKTTDSRKESVSGDEAETVSTEAPKVNVLVVAAKKEIIESYQTMAAAAGFKLAALGLRSYANARCLQACDLISKGEYVALISLRPDEVIIDVLGDQFLVFSRGTTIRHPSPKDQDAPPETNLHQEPSEADAPPDDDPEFNFISNVTIEVVRSLHSFDGTSSTRGPVTKVVVAGATGHEHAVVNALKNRLSIPCTLLNPSAELGLPESDRTQTSGSLAAFGLGLGFSDPEGLPFDFLNPKKPADPAQIKRRRIMLSSAAAFIVLMSLLFLRHHLLSGRLELQKTVRSQITQETKNRKLYRQVIVQARSVSSWINAEKSWLDHYAFLSHILPGKRELYLTSFSAGNRGNIRLGLQAKSGETIATLTRRLREAGYQLKPLAINPSADRHGYPFKSSVELTIPANQTIDLKTASSLPATNAPASQP